MNCALNILIHNFLQIVLKMQSGGSEIHSRKYKHLMHDQKLKKKLNIVWSSAKKKLKYVV